MKSVLKISTNVRIWFHCSSFLKAIGFQNTATTCQTSFLHLGLCNYKVTDVSDVELRYLEATFCRLQEAYIDYMYQIAKMVSPYHLGTFTTKLLDLYVNYYHIQYPSSWIFNIQAV